MTEIEIYKPSICWYGRSNKPIHDASTRKDEVSEHTCANPNAALYDVTAGGLNKVPGTTIRMWLCPKHVNAMMRRGFIVTKAVLL
jgi:hypothetical protein